MEIPKNCSLIYLYSGEQSSIKQQIFILSALQLTQLKAPFPCIVFQFYFFLKAPFCGL